MSVENEQKILILASSSPRRQQLLQALHLQFIVRASDADETTPPDISPDRTVEMLSLRKAQQVFEQIQEQFIEGVVIGADTVVVYQDEILGKPRDADDAFRMLQLLQGQAHEVYSGVTCIDIASGKISTAHRVTKVRMKALDSHTMRRYIATDEPLDKAGAYAIQGIGAVLIEGIEGDYFNVVGLPISLLSEQLSGFGIQIL
ncbi:MAG: septum formation protein Maf [Paenibacillus sp. RIFOXYA1_FULL_44_5]|nr:MAG: septum formation protein Maf [Paenibacillus sp. RIFOXYA1_FULL_44_5]